MAHNLIDKLAHGNLDSIPDMPNGGGIHEIPANTYTGESKWVLLSDILLNNSFSWDRYCMPNIADLDLII